MKVVFYNGAFITEKDFSISSNSRAFNYGDGFFETVKIINSKPFNFSCHLERIKLGLSVLKISDKYTSIFFQEQISQLLKLNKMVNGSIKIHISRSGAGRYLPKSNHSDLFICTIDGLGYKHNNAISLCFYDQQCKALGSLSNIKSVNSLVSVLGSIHANERNFDNAILLNTSGNIIEATNANIFIVKDEKIYTPSLSDGCVDGTMRKWISKELTIIEKSILSDQIIDADEVFLSNSTSGIISVKSIEDTCFSSFNTANFIQQQLINSSLDF